MDFIEPLITQLRAQGLLLQQDALLPNVVAAVAGQPVRGSWWAHPQGHAIYNILNALAEHPDVLVTRLVQGKVTFVHRRLWGAVLAVGQSQAPKSIPTRGTMPFASKVGQPGRNGLNANHHSPPAPGRKRSRPRSRRSVELPQCCRGRPEPLVHKPGASVRAQVEVYGDQAQPLANSIGA